MPEKGNILVVDDDRDICITMKEILEYDGYMVTLAFDGYEALEAAKNDSFDVVLMDIRMPGIDGVETFKRLKAFSSIPVILISAYAIEDLIKDALNEGVFAIIEKPVKFDLLLEIIEKTKQDGSLVMVIDDDATACDVLKDVLTSNNYRVAVAHDGVSAIKEIQMANYDIFILDMKLPVLNGLETYLAIHELRPNAVVIVVTAYPLEMDGLARQAIAKGAYHYLQKPFSTEKLLEILNQVKTRNNADNK
jgi:two-component system, NtrC family, response regulator HydG